MRFRPLCPAHPEAPVKRKLPRAPARTHGARAHTARLPLHVPSRLSPDPALIHIRVRPSETVLKSAYYLHQLVRSSDSCGTLGYWGVRPGASHCDARNCVAEFFRCVRTIDLTHTLALCVLPTQNPFVITRYERHRRAPEPAVQTYKEELGRGCAGHTAL